MDELGGARAGAVGEILLLDEGDGETAAGRVASDAGAVDAAADHQQIDLGPELFPHLLSSRHGRRSR